MTIVTARTPSGFPEYLPAQQIEFNRLLSIIKATYEKYGFSPIDTPAVELSEVLLTKSGGETEKQVYRFTKGNNDLMLPFDLTVPLARYVGQHEGQLTFPLRRYQIAKVHRGERSQAGRFREFYQCDIDVVGSQSVLVDAELPAVINDIFSQFNFGEFTIHINDRQILNGILEHLGLSHAAPEVLRIIDKRDKLLPEDYHDELVSVGLTNDMVKTLEDLTGAAGSNDAILDKLSSYHIENDTFKKGVSNIHSIINLLRDFNIPESRFCIDLSIARGLDYYTGVVYETTLNDYPELGSVCSGGRYDNLAANYTKSSLPGVGISIGLTRLFHHLEQLKTDMNQQTVADVVIIPVEEAQAPAAIIAAQQLRDTGISTIIHSDTNKLKKRLSYANKIGVPFVVLLGESEVEEGIVTIKNMLTGESYSVPQEETASTIADARKAIK